MPPHLDCRCRVKRADFARAVPEERPPGNASGSGPAQVQRSLRMQPPALPVPGPLALLDTTGESGSSIPAGLPLASASPSTSRSAGLVLPASLELYLWYLCAGTGPSFILALPLFSLPLSLFFFCMSLT